MNLQKNNLEELAMYLNPGGEEEVGNGNGGTGGEGEGGSEGGEGGEKV